jgi:predicted membrane channel-forming protein YqfA (hemolysin III family)
MSLATARNIAIVLVLAALVALIPGGGTGATVAIQAVSLAFVATLGWFASLMYRQHRSTLYSLGDRRRALLYVALGVAAVTLTGTTRLWSTAAGSVAWLLLIGGALYTVFAIFWAARRY